jgi:maleate cis-trans isomerase
MIGQLGAGRTVTNQSMLPPETALELARTLHHQFPDADSVYFPSPHWGTMSSIQLIEDELGLNAMSATLAILWDSLRSCAITEKRLGYGRLLREF